MTSSFCFVFVFLCSLCRAKWTKYNQTTLPRSDSGMCVGHWDKSMYIIGGNTFSHQVTEFVIANQTFVDKGISSLPSNTKLYGQYAQISSLLFVLQEPGYLGVYQMKNNLFISNWSLIPFHPAARPGDWPGCLTSSSSKLFIVGGSSADGSSVEMVQILDMSSQQWLDPVSIIDYRYSLACNVNPFNENEVFAIGGLGLLTSIERINTATNVSEYTQDDLIYPIATNGRAVIFKSAIYVFGSCDYSQMMFVCYYMNLVQIIDPVYGFVSIADDILPYGVSGVAAIDVWNELYAFGGSVNRSSFDAETTDNWMKLPAILPVHPILILTRDPTVWLTLPPKNTPSSNPSETPSTSPSFEPTINPTTTVTPTLNPTIYPTTVPTQEPSMHPTIGLNLDPTRKPTMSSILSLQPTNVPTKPPPSNYPTSDPTHEPSVSTTDDASAVFSSQPSEPTATLLDDTATPSEQQSGDIWDLLEGSDDWLIFLICIGLLVFICVDILCGIWIYKIIQSNKDTTLRGNRVLEAMNAHVHVDKNKKEKQQNIKNNGLDIVQTETKRGSVNIEQLIDDRANIKAWLYTLQLDVYYDNFISNGYESMNFIQRIEDKSQLQEIGIYSGDDQIKILEAINSKQMEGKSDEPKEIEYVLKTPEEYDETMDEGEG